MDSSSFYTQDQGILLPQQPVRLLKFVKAEWYNILHIKIIKIIKIYFKVRHASSIPSPPLCHRQNLSSCTNANQNVFKHLGEENKASCKSQIT